MGIPLPDLAVKLLEDHTFFVLSTVNKDGWPQSSVIWAKRDGDTVVFSTIRGRQKTRNMERDPRVSLVAYDPENPYAYVEIRGTVTLDEAGGDALIDELCRAYNEGRPWAHRPAETRVVCRVTPKKAVVH